MSRGLAGGGGQMVFASSFAAVECRGVQAGPCFAPGSSEVAVGFFYLDLYLIVHNVPQRHTHTVIFSPFGSCCLRTPLSAKHCSTAAKPCRTGFTLDSREILAVTRKPQP